MIKVPSSGGYGDPLARPAEVAFEDVLDEIVSVESARSLYGVIIENRKLDVQATESWRQELRQQRSISVPTYTD
jgi:N-methylhydantoinase B